MKKNRKDLLAVLFLSIHNIIHMDNTLNIKAQIHAACLQEVADRLTIIKNRLVSIQESKNNETKSSAGDKYETGRAMMQIEEENIMKQRAKVLADQKSLMAIQHQKRYTEAINGAVVMTNQLNFYISVALGKIEFGGVTYYCISKQSPIGQQLLMKQKGDKVKVNNREYVLVNVF